MAGAVGAFGKMPSVGDFFRVDAPAGFVQAWDAWLQQGMLAAAGALGPAWDDSYMSAPIWRFSLSAGLAGKDAVIGVLMPSVDRVGRRFPLTLMCPVSAPAMQSHLTATTTFEALEDIALDALGDDMTRDVLIDRLASIEAPTSTTTPRMHTAGATLSLTESQAGGDLAAPLTVGLADQRYHAPSIWTAILHEGRRSLICEGLPQGAEQVALFDLTSPIWKEAQSP